MKNKKVLIVGGQFGVYGHLAAWRLCQGVDVIGVIASSAEKTRQINIKNKLPLREENYEKALRHVDIVSFAVPPAQQFNLAQLAIKQKKQIVFDKPLAANLAQAKKLAQLCKKAKVKNCINFEFPELETFKLVKKIIDEKTYGEVLHFFIDWRLETMAFKNKSKNWKARPSNGGGFWFHYFAHTLHMVEWLFGDIKKHQFTLGNVQNFPSTLVAGTVVTKNNVCGSITGTCVAQKSLGHRIEIHTTNASIILWNKSKDPIKDFELQIYSGDKIFHVSEKQNFTGAAKKVDSRALPMSKLFQKFLNGEKVPDVKQGLKAQIILGSAQS